MHVDLYTKVVLTLIACCLLYFVFKDVSIVPEAYGETQGTAEAVMDVNVVAVGGEKIRSSHDRSSPKNVIPVRVMNRNR